MEKLDSYDRTLAYVYLQDDRMRELKEVLDYFEDLMDSTRNITHF